MQIRQQQLISLISAYSLDIKTNILSLEIDLNV